VWTYARWVAALAAAILIYAIVYAFAPDISPRRFRWISPGAVLGVVLWLLASGAFFFYVSNFSSYGATYGAFASAVVLLLWLYITNLCLLLGGELNAEFERSERAARGAPPPPSPPPTAGREGVAASAPARR
jgi:membrane protein